MLPISYFQCHSTFQADEPDTYSIKVWDQLSLDPDSNKTIFSFKRTLKLSRQKTPTCFSAHENLHLLAVGYCDGFLQLYRGEVFRKPLKRFGLDLELDFLFEL